jgi:hypothetical protein
MLGDMLFRSYAPAAPLADFVQDFWLYDDYRPRHLRERILPSATVELVINLGDDELRTTIAHGPVSASASPGPSSLEPTTASS